MRVGTGSEPVLLAWCSPGQEADGGRDQFAVHDPRMGAGIECRWRWPAGHPEQRPSERRSSERRSPRQVDRPRRLIAAEGASAPEGSARRGRTMASGGRVELDPAAPRRAAPMRCAVEQDAYANLALPAC